MGYPQGDLTLSETTPSSKKFRGRARKKASTSFCYETVNNSNDKGKYMSRKSRRNNNQPRENQAEKNHFELRHIQPLTVNQERVFDAYNSGANLMLHGYAGTGKTFLSTYLALKEVLENDIYKKVVIIRSVVPSREIGRAHV